MSNRIVTFGEIMLRLATPLHKRFSQADSFCASFGGGEANVAVSLANYGLEADFVTRLPDNDLGRAVIMELKKHGVGTENILFGGERLGIYFLETGSVSRPSKVVYDRSHSSVSEIAPGMVDWERVFEGASWFHWTGITPAISKGAADSCLEAVKAAKKAGLTVSCDVYFR
jgi:2-dehydro-3-deoxygluconokinase